MTVKTAEHTAGGLAYERENKKKSGGKKDTTPRVNRAGGWGTDQGTERKNLHKCNRGGFKKDILNKREGDREGEGKGPKKLPPRGKKNPSTKKAGKTEKKS